MAYIYLYLKHSIQKNTLKNVNIINIFPAIKYAKKAVNKSIIAWKLCHPS